MIDFYPNRLVMPDTSLEIDIEDFLKEEQELRTEETCIFLLEKFIQSLELNKPEK